MALRVREEGGDRGAGRRLQEGDEDVGGGVGGALGYGVGAVAGEKGTAPGRGG